MTDTEMIASTASTEKDGPESPDRWLTVAWPLALIFHLLGNSGYLVAMMQGQPTIVALLQLVIAALAVLVVAQPRVPYVLLLSVVFMATTFFKLPFIGNHELILVMSALVVAASVLASDRRWPSTALPLFRWLLIIAYGSIAFSKLNASFFDPSVSCAVVFGDEFSEWVGVRLSDARSLSVAAIWMTALIELAIPILLVIRRVRLLGVVVAMVFHYLLALEPVGHVFDFTATLFPLFLAFAPADITQRLSDRIDGLAGGRGRSALAVGAVAVLAAHGMVMNTVLPIWTVAYPVWLVVATVTVWWVIGGVVARTGRGRGLAGDRVEARAPLVILVPLVALLVINAVAPYLQLRTASAFNMYSNLETVHVDGDHFVLSGLAAARSNELVMVVAAPSDHPLAFYLDSNRAIPADNLRWYQRNVLASTPDGISPDQDDDVELRWLVSADVDPPTRLSDLDPGAGGWRELLAYKFGFVRAVDVSSPARCLRTWGPAG